MDPEFVFVLWPGIVARHRTSSTLNDDGPGGGKLDVKRITLALLGSSMLLRQRAARPTTHKTIARASEEPRTGGRDSSTANRKCETSNHTNDSRPQVPTQQRRNGIRPNRILGRIVPVILLVYVAYTYDLVVFRYAYQYTYRRRGKTLLTILWMLPVQAILLFSLGAYLRVYLAHDLSTSSELQSRGSLAWLQTRLGARFPGPDQAQRLEHRQIVEGASRLAQNSTQAEIHIELCQRDGQPVRCWRDDCAGRIKALRTRHCGDCGTCRVGFDHHCAWFDNDITAPATLRPFLGFLVSVIPLYLLGLGPLFPSAWQTLRQIHAFAATDAVLQASWWGRWYSWIGGPAFRWMVGFTLGAMRWSASTVERFPHESPRAPFLIAIGAVFVFVAIALATSTLNQLRRGMLTIDLERWKAFDKLERRKRTLEQTLDGTKDDRLTQVEHKMESLAPVQHFRVCVKDRESGETNEAIVALSILEGLLSHGSFCTNLKQFLGLTQTLALSTPSWSLNETALRKVLEKASNQIHD